MKKGFGVGVWKATRKEWGFVSSRISFTVDNRQRVKFWKDKWCGNGLLCNSFLSLFALASSKDVWDSFVLGRGVGAPLSLDPLMIGKWEVRRGFFHAWMR